jgi:thiol-disulfide isomerase/thioredoxin
LADSPATQTWSDCVAKRERLVSAHQEFEVSQTLKTTTGSQSSKRQLILDLASLRRREISVSGSGKRIRIFDGKDVLSTEEGGEEFIRLKPKAKEPPVPSPYDTAEPDWSKAVLSERQSCGIPGREDQCVAVEAPVKPWMRGNTVKMLQGDERMVFHLDSGLLFAVRITEVLANPQRRYQRDTVYTLKRLGYGAVVDEKLFELPPGGLREVKQLSRWDAPKIRKQLAGKPAPELEVTDMQGQPVSLSAFHGKTVPLDFWTTWCPPCRADAPALDKLYRKNGSRDLMIVGVSVSQDRPVVEKFLKEHPHEFPIVLTTENEMPRPYEVGAFPTYIVIDRDGNLTSAAEGDQGFSELRRLLKKAGLEVD